MSASSNGRDTEAVYERVREAILEGEIAPGATMSQVALADELGISRTPLREALRMLQSEGLVEAERNRRVRVAAVSPVDLEELCIMRVTLEAEAIRLAGAADDRRGPGAARGLRWPRWRTSPRRRTTAAGPSRTRRSTAALTAPAGDRFTAVLGQLFDHAERYRRLHIGHGPTRVGDRRTTARSSTPARRATARRPGAARRALRPHGVRGDRAARADVRAGPPARDAQRERRRQTLSETTRSPSAGTDRAVRDAAGDDRQLARRQRRAARRRRRSRPCRPRSTNVTWSSGCACSSHAQPGS